MELNKVHHGDCLAVLKTFPDNSIDSICCDPPYGLSFMGKKWDYDVPSTEIWGECLRVLKPGGYLLAFAGTRTQHRMAVRIEDAGFEIRDIIAWVYGSGFPKSLNIGKAIDKMEGTEYPKNTLVSENGSMTGGNYTRNTVDVQSEVAKQWEGWGTALKPALEPITVARKPLSEKTVAENVLKWGTGGINIDGSKVGTEERFNAPAGNTGNEPVPIIKSNDEYKGKEVMGRFPANLIHDGSDEILKVFPNDSQRFFYCAKTSKSERNRGCEDIEQKQTTGGGGLTAEVREDGSLETASAGGKYGSIKALQSNSHPTVKPIALMEYLVKLVTKENAIVLDPFAGSGSTLLACKNLNRNYIGIEREADYIEIIKARLSVDN